MITDKGHQTLTTRRMTLSFFEFAIMADGSSDRE